MRATGFGRCENAYVYRHFRHSGECEMHHYRRIIGGVMGPSGVEVDEAEIDAGGGGGCAIRGAHGGYAGDALRAA